jgi:hypothetical protein
MNAIHALSQLSYSPTWSEIKLTYIKKDCQLFGVEGLKLELVFGTN